MEHIISKYLNGELGQIIYAGVGNSPALATILPLAYKSLQLIEPINTIYERLDKKFASESVQVKNMAISSAGGIADFTITQPVKYSSLKKNIALEHVLKNSAITSTEAIQTISLSDLIKQSALTENDNNIIILSINGAEFDCLATVKLEELTLFSTLFVQIENHGVYSENKNTEAELKSLLRTLGFYFECRQQEGAIFTSLVFKRDDTLLDCLRSLQKLKRKNQEERDKANDFLATKEKDKAEFISSITQLEEQCTELEARSSLLNAEKQQLAEQKATVQKQSEAQKQELAQKVEQLENQLAQVKQSKESEKAEFVARCSQLEAEKQQLAARSSKLDIQLANLQSQRDELVKSNSNKDKQIKTLTEQRDKEQLTNKELNHHQVLLTREIMKTEAQLELIKDIVIREKAF